MLDWQDLSIAEVLGPGGLLARVHRDFEPRQGQLAMAEAVHRAIQEGGPVAVEAPTGVGKTLAYLVPALLSRKRVLVSTHTKTLQEQIIDKDIPLLERVFRSAGLELVRAEPKIGRLDGLRRYALMKGRANYLCKHRLEQRQRMLFEREADRRALDLINAWSGKTRRGDRAELPTLEEDTPLWEELDARAETCLGSRCPRHDECFVVRMRQEAESADLIVVNHHLLLADLTVRAEAQMAGDRGALGEVIPRAEVLIIDEAHTLEEVASEYFGGEISTRKLERFLRDAMSWLAERKIGSDALALRSSEAVALAEQTFTLLPHADGRVRVPPPTLIDDPFRRARQKSIEAAVRLAELSDAFGQVEGDAGAESLTRRAKGLSDALRFVLAAADPDFVYWAERGKKSSRIGAAPIAVDDLLRRHIFDAFDSVVLASATLATGPETQSGLDPGFKYFLERVGAPEETEAIRLSTPFDYKKQVALFVPRALPNPDAPGFLEAICKIGQGLIEQLGGGAFFLFTSHRMMRLAHARLAARLPFPVLLQGEAPKRQLLRDFVRRAPAVLFATASFWEGVDVPGDPLRLVLIDRLPFASPADPVVSSRLERLAARGEDPFSAYQLPQAILRLKQGFGRLVRRSSDRGVVAILDPRLSTKRYGRRFIEALPEAAVIREPEALASWLSNQGMLEPPINDSWIEPLWEDGGDLGW